jgi:hypothetical protein
MGWQRGRGKHRNPWKFKSTISGLPVRFYRFDQWREPDDINNWGAGRYCHCCHWIRPCGGSSITSSAAINWLDLANWQMLKGKEMLLHTIYQIT